MELATTPLGHKEARQLFAPLVDRELAPADEAALRHHLADCADCQRGLERYSRAVELVRTADRERAPLDFTALVMRRVRRRRRARWFGGQGGRLFEHVSIPAEAAIPVILAAIVAAILIFAAP